MISIKPFLQNIFIMLSVSKEMFFGLKKLANIQMLNTQKKIDGKF